MVRDNESWREVERGDEEMEEREKERDETRAEQNK